MDYLYKIPLLSFGSLLVLFILTKLMGNKEISQLSMFDYTIGITIGSIAAEMATALEDNFMEPLIAMVVYAIIAIIISLISCKSLGFRRFIEGKALILYDNGIIYKANLKKAKLDISEFLMQCRTNGFFNLSDIQTVILESGGKISILPKSFKRPANPSDFNLNPNPDNIVTNIILDGKILYKNLSSIGKNEKWLLNEIKNQGIPNPKHIFLATFDNQENLSLYKKVNTKTSGEPFE